MRTMTEHQMDCEELAAIDAELALGVADARTRAAALQHLERCPSCRRRVQRLSEVSEGLTELVPPVEPPVGFESRVISQLRPTPSRAGGIAGHRFAMAAAVVVLALIAGVAGWLVGTSGGTAHAPSLPSATTNGHVVSAELVGQHGPLGQVVLSSGKDPWLSMAVQADVGQGRVRCQAVEGDGRVVTLGSFPVTGGYGYWASPLPTGTTVRAVRLVDRSGAVLATADVGSWSS